MKLRDFVSEAEKAPSLAIIAGLTISEWHCIKLYALHYEIPDEKELNPWSEK